MKEDSNQSLNNFILHSEFVGRNSFWHEQYREKQPSKQTTIIFLRDQRDATDLTNEHIGTHPFDKRRSHIENMGI